MAQVFISYSRRDLEFVKRLSADLQAAGLKVWYDLSGLEAGTRWGIEIQDALDKSCFFLVVLSPNSCRSEWVEREFLYASNQGLKIVPILYQPCKLPLWSLNLHYLELGDENYESGFPNLCRILGVKPPLRMAVIPLAEEMVPYLPAHEETVSTLPVPTLQPTPPVMETLMGKKSPGRQKENPTLRPGIKKTWGFGLGILVVVTLLVLGIIFFDRDIRAALFPGKETQTISSSQLAGESPTPTISGEITSIATQLINSDGIRIADGMQMVYVPAGEFTMGSDEGDDDKRPVHPVYLDAYWIDQTEVTNAMYIKCVQEGACQVPSIVASYTRSNYYDNPLYADYPALIPSWSLASTYCIWAGGRLPTEAEWEKTARGTEDMLYPWGSEAPTCSQGNFLPVEIPVLAIPARLVHILLGQISMVRWTWQEMYGNGQGTTMAFIQSRW